MIHDKNGKKFYLSILDLILSIISWKFNLNNKVWFMVMFIPSYLGWLVAILKAKLEIKPRSRPSASGMRRPLFILIVNPERWTEILIRCSRESKESLASASVTATYTYNVKINPNCNEWRLHSKCELVLSSSDFGRKKKSFNQELKAGLKKLDNNQHIVNIWLKLWSWIWLGSP